MQYCLYHHSYFTIVQEFQTISEYRYNDTSQKQLSWHPLTDLETAHNWQNYLLANFCDHIELSLRSDNFRELWKYLTTIPTCECFWTATVWQKAFICGRIVCYHEWFTIIYCLLGMTISMTVKWLFRYFGLEFLNDTLWTQLPRDPLARSFAPISNGQYHYAIVEEHWWLKIPKSCAKYV